MRRYLFLLAYESSNWDEAGEETREQYRLDHDAFSVYVAGHGREVCSAALAELGQATTVTIGGYDVELPDLDAAIAAASLLPSSYSIEIRPTVTIA